MKVIKKNLLTKISSSNSEEISEQVHDFVTLVRDLLENDPRRISEVFSTLHPATAASVLQFLVGHEREAVISELGQNFDPEILSFLDESIRESMLDLWAVHEIAQKLEQLDGQDALKILEELDKEERRALLRALNPDIRVFLEEGLAYPEDSAGRLMQRQVVAIPQEWNVAKTRDFLTTATNLPQDLSEIFLVDKSRKPIAKLCVVSLLNADAKTKVKDLAVPLEITFPAIADEKDIMFAFKTFALKSAPVVDKHDKLIGVLWVNDMIDVMYTEAQEEFLHAGGLEDSDFYDNVRKTTQARLRWLSFSIFGSTGVAMLMAMFNDVIAQKPELFPLLAVIMNISAVAGIQVVTVIIRALVNRELSFINIKRTLLKESLVAIINGILLGLFFGLLFTVRNMDYRIGLVFAASLILTMIYGALAGTVFPNIFNKLGFDPSLSSGAFLSCTIDAFATISFLLIARMVFL